MRAKDRKLKTRPIHECRCDERLKAKAERNLHISHTLVLQLHRRTDPYGRTPAVFFFHKTFQKSVITTSEALKSEYLEEHLPNPEVEKSTDGLRKLNS